MKQGMKESYRKGVANHPDPESCAGHRKRASEVLTGAQAGRKSSCEISFNCGVPTLSFGAEGNIGQGALRVLPEPCAV
jgi:RNA-directed DNA polymerase